MNWQPGDSPDEIFAGLVSCAQNTTGSRADRMRTIADALWDALSPRGVSWIGFYEIAREGNDHAVEPGSPRPLIRRRREWPEMTCCVASGPTADTFGERRAERLDRAWLRM